VTDRTIRLHRVLTAKPEKVYKAFVDADAKARWLPPNGFTCKVHSFDAKVGGAYEMSFTNFSTGNSHSWTGKFLELVPGERVRYADRFDDPNLPGEMVVKVGTAASFSIATSLDQPPVSKMTIAPSRRVVRSPRSWLV